MQSAYTTADLIQILANERRACLKGERLKLALRKPVINPLLDQFIQTEGLQKFAAYQDFREAVHRYQLSYQVSGIVWRQVTIRGRTWRYPEINDQLIALPSDQAQLKAAIPGVLHFWQQVTTDMTLYLVTDHYPTYQPMQVRDVDYLAQRSDWVTLTRYDYAQILEVVLQLGWGEPREAQGRRGWPQAGSEMVCAVSQGQTPMTRL